MARVIDFYARFVNYGDVIRDVKDMKKKLKLSIKTAMTLSLDVIGQTAVSKYMVEANVVFDKKKRPKIRRKQNQKLNIVTTRLSRSILNTYSFAQGAPGTNEAIREVKVEKGRVIGVIGSKVPYAAIHEFGGVINQTNLFGRGIKATINIPARPYLRPAIKDSRPKIIELIGEYIGRAVND